MTSIRIIKTSNGVTLAMQLNNETKLTTLTSLSNILCNNFNTNEKTKSILDHIDKYMYKDLCTEILPFDSIDTLNVQAQNHTSVKQLTVSLSIKNSNIYLKGQLDNFLNSLKQTLSIIFGRHVFLNYKLTITFDNCIFYDIILKSLGDNCTISNSKGYIYLLTIIGNLIVQNSYIDFYTTDTLVSATDYEKSPLKQSIIMIEAKTLENAIGKFKGHLLCYNLSADDFLDSNNVFFYRSEQTLNKTSKLTMTVEQVEEGFCTLTHIPTCTSIYLKNKTYTNDVSNGVFVLDAQCDFAPTEYMKELYTNLQKKELKCINYQIINSVLQNA